MMILSTKANLLQIGQTAPEWSAMDQNQRIHQSKNYLGSWVLLYFYPKDNTPGCTKEACSFRDSYAELKKHLVLLGVSADSTQSHLKFSQKFNLPFPLLSDENKKIIQSFKADGLVMAKRVSFLINPEGKIAKIYPKVDVATHAQEILGDIANLTQH